MKKYMQTFTWNGFGIISQTFMFPLTVRYTGTQKQKFPCAFFMWKKGAENVQCTTHSLSLLQEYLNQRLHVLSLCDI